MRGKPEQQLAMRTSLSTEDLIAHRSSDPPDPQGHRQGPGRPRWRARRHAFPDRTTERAARAALEGHGAHGSVLRAQRAGVLRALELRPCCSSVPRPAHRPPRPSTPRPSPRTETGSWTTRSPTGSSPRWCARRSCAATSRATTSPLTGRCWRHGRRTRASSPRTAPDPPSPRRGATPRSTSGARPAPTRRTPRPPTPRRCWPASRTTPQRGSATPGTCSWRTAAP